MYVGEVENTTTMNNFTELLNDAATYGFNIEAIKADIADGKLTQQEAADRLMEEIYGEGGAAGY